MGLYISSNDVKVRLDGKVRFEANPDTDSGAMSEALLNRLINEAEGDVELDLSERYHTPFKSISGGDFATLPDRPTKEYLRTMCELKAVIRVLETDFGSGAVDAESYMKNLRSRYDKMYNKLIDRRGDDEDQNQFRKPPLPGLMLNYHNDQADDGYRGMVCNTSDSEPYAPGQINDPSATWFNTSYGYDKLWD